MSKNVVEPEGPQVTSQHGAYGLLLDKQGYMHMQTDM
jgi:hypothetical protein